MDFTNVKPVLEDGITSVFAPAFVIFSLPFAETVLFIFVLSSLKKPANTSKVYIISLGIALVTFLLVTFRNIFILDSLTAVHAFPSFSAIKIVSIGTLIQRIEVTVAVVFVLVGIVKFSICLFVASKGIAKILNFDSYRSITAPIAFITLVLSSILYASFNEMVEWLEVYPYYASLFQVVIPIIMLLYFEVLNRKKKMNQI